MTRALSQNASNNLWNTLLQIDDSPNHSYTPLAAWTMKFKSGKYLLASCTAKAFRWTIQWIPINWGTFSLNLATNSCHSLVIDATSSVAITTSVWRSKCILFRSPSMVVNIHALVPHKWHKLNLFNQNKYFFCFAQVYNTYNQMRFIVRLVASSTSIENTKPLHHKCLHIVGLRLKEGHKKFQGQKSYS